MFILYRKRLYMHLVQTAANLTVVYTLYLGFILGLHVSGESYSRLHIVLGDL